MKEIVITERILNKEYLNEVAKEEYREELISLTEESQYQIFMIAVNKYLKGEIEEGEIAEVRFDIKGVNFKNRRLKYLKREGELYLDQKEVEKFFEVELDERTVKTINERLIRIPKDLKFEHPLTEYENERGEVIKEINESKRVYLNNWGVASNIINLVMIEEDSRAERDIYKLLSKMDKKKVKQLIEEVRNRNLASCMELSCHLKEGIDNYLERKE